MFCYILQLSAVVNEYGICSKPLFITRKSYQVFRPLRLINFVEICACILLVWLFHFHTIAENPYFEYKHSYYELILLADYTKSTKCFTKSWIQKINIFLYDLLTLYFQIKKMCSQSKHHYSELVATLNFRLTQIKVTIILQHNCQHSFYRQQIQNRWIVTSVIAVI